jgi:SAM-dependent methyltransferase
VDEKAAAFAPTSSAPMRATMRIIMPHSTSDWAHKSIDEIPSTLHLWDRLFRYIDRQHAIVDMGCGLGSTVIALHQRGYDKAVGIDVNDAAIGTARRLGAVLGLPPSAFQTADARRTGLPSASFHAAILQAVLCLIDDPTTREDVVAEAARLLAPGAIIYIADFLQAWHLDLYRDRYLAGYQQYGEWGTFNVVNSDGQRMYTAHHFTDRELVDLIRAAHFRIEEFEYHPVVTRSGSSIWGLVAIARRPCA